jgi:hypothetical protein
MAEAAVVGAGAGAALGALVGLALPPGESWHEMKVRRVQASVAPVRRGVQFRVAFTF